MPPSICLSIAWLFWHRIRLHPKESRGLARILLFAPAKQNRPHRLADFVAGDRNGVAEIAQPAAHQPGKLQQRCDQGHSHPAVSGKDMAHAVAPEARRRKSDDAPVPILVHYRGVGSER
ncbi:hypothetical protein [Sphingomonas sp.]|uniref:hypothetical protein n=1 Tax=Sphingomonas sp. TaxID=28214 RepID=UPI002FDAA586